MTLLWLLLISAHPVIEVEAVVSLEPSMACAVSEELVARAAHVLDSEVRLERGDVAGLEGCTLKRSIEAGEDRVLIRLVRSPSLIRVIGERRRDGTVTASSSVDLQIGRTGWVPALDPLVAALFRRPGREALVETAPPAGPGALFVSSLALTGAAAVSLAIGVALGVSSDAARGDLAAQVALDPEFVRRQQGVTGQATAANVMFGLAGAALVAAGTLWFLDDGSP